MAATCTGDLRQGRLSLLMGPPGAGKSVFLKALGGRLKPDDDLRTSGELQLSHCFIALTEEAPGAGADGASIRHAHARHVRSVKGLTPARGLRLTRSRVFDRHDPLQRPVRG